MPTNKFSSSWINLREPFDSVSRSDLLINKYNEKKYNLADHDQALLNNFYSITRRYLSK